MSEGSGAEHRDGFANLLRGLKDRSGLSYGALAKRLHLSTSTLHRYCNGTAVPNDYAPVERMARVCRATPDELVELHRAWILADASRGRALPTPTPTPDVRADRAPVVADAPEVTAGPMAPDGPLAADEPVGVAEPVAADEPVVVDAPAAAAPAPRRRRRTARLAAVAVAAALGTVALVLHPPSGWGGDDARDAQGAGPGAGQPSTSGPATPPASGQSRAPSASASAEPTATGEDEPGASKDGGGGDGPEPTGDTTGVPLNVATRPYVYENPCAQHFLVDSAPEQVGPPASEQDAPRWADAYGAVSSGEQRIALTVQGTGKDTVVLEELHVRVVGKAAPLAWNDYSMGVGCGGDVETKSFDVDLDNGSPGVTVKNGQRDFPYKVSESDPEVFYLTAHSAAHDVRWELALDWSSGDRHGTVRINNDGKPFRTSADAGRPGYDYPLGGSEWIERVEG